MLSAVAPGRPQILRSSAPFAWQAIQPRAVDRSKQVRRFKPPDGRRDGLDGALGGFRDARKAREAEASSAWPRCAANRRDRPLCLEPCATPGFLAGRRHIPTRVRVRLLIRGAL